MTYTETDYQRERAIVDKANTYYTTYLKSARSGAAVRALATHPDYAACDNAMRGRVEAWGLAKDKPAVFVAYVSRDNASVTTWTGDLIGKVTSCRRHKARTWNGGHTTMYQYRVTAFGRRYYGKSQGEGMCITLRAYKDK